MKTAPRSAILLSGIVLSACAKDSAVQPSDVPELYAPATAVGVDDRCAALAAEVASLDTGLGSPAGDDGPPVPATAGARWLDYGRDLVVQTVLGPLQPIIQTVRAATNYEDKTRIATVSEDRANVRRAYLLGSMDGANCPKP